MLRVKEQYAGTDTGKQRRANEDSLLAIPPLFIVADGMGGARAGEVASSLAVEGFKDGLNLAAQDGTEALTERIAQANLRIHELSRANAAQAGMGTTITALLVGAEAVTVAHVGDSRAYRIRSGHLERLTDDHSLVDELIRQGRLAPEEAHDHPQRSVITRALGPEPEVLVDTRTEPAQAGDLYLLCSDGLTSMIDEQQIAAIIAAQDSLQAAGEALLRAANQAGGRDNITVILLRLEHAEEGAAGKHAAADQLDESEHTVVMQAVDLAGGEAASAQAQGTRSAVARRLPRRPEGTRRGPGRRGAFGRRMLRPGVGSLVVLAILGVLLAGGYLASQSVYFLGTNARGMLTIYTGLPYELPAGINLYTPYYVSGVPAGTLAPARRAKLLDNAWHSESAAAQLVREIELEQAGVG